VVVPTGLPESATLEDQPIVAADDRHRALGSQGTEPLEAASSARSASLARHATRIHSQSLHDHGNRSPW
jgi:hypothetical protein